MAEVVVTQFQLDISQYEANLAKATKGMEGFDKSTDAAEDGTKELGTELGSASDKLKTLDATTKQTGKSLKDFEKESTGVGAAMKGVGNELNKLFPAVGRVASSVKVLGLAIKTALGPIGLIVAGVVAAFAGLVKIFAGTQEGADKLNRILEPLKAGLAATFGLLQTISRVAVDTLRVLANVATFNFSGAKEAFDDLKGSASEAGSAIVGFGSTLAEAAAKGARIQAIKEELADLAITIAQNEGRINREFQEQVQLAQNVNATNEEREAAAREAIRLQEEMTALRLRELDLQIEQLTIQQSLNDTSKEEKLQLAQLVAARDQALADQLSSTRRVQNTLNTIQKQAAEKAIAEAKRRRDEEVKRLEEIATAEQSLADIKEGLSTRALERSLDQYGRSALAAEQGTEREIKAAKALFDRLAQLSAGNKAETARIEQELAAVILALRQDLDAKLDDLQQKRIDEDEKKKDIELGKIREALTAEDVLRRDAIDKEFDLLVSSAERRITDEEELTETLVALQIERQRRLGEVISEAQQAEIDAQQAETERLQAIQEERLAILESAGDQVGDVVEGVANNSIKTAQEASKAILSIALDTAEKQALVAVANATTGSISSQQSIATGGVAGIAQAAILSALIRGAFALLKSQLAGSFYEGGIVGKDGGTKVHSGRDGYLIRAHQGEHIMPTDKTNKYLPYLEAMRHGNFEDMIRTTAQLNSFSPPSLTQVPSFNDRRLVGAMGGVGSIEEQRKQTELLAALNRQLSQRPSKRYYA